MTPICSTIIPHQHIKGNKLFKYNNLPADSDLLTSAQGLAKHMSAARASSQFWLGHENRDFSREYAEQLQDDVEWRQEIVAQVGIGFEIPTSSVIPDVPKRPAKRSLSKAA